MHFSGKFITAEDVEREALEAISCIFGKCMKEYFGID
jgi:hypothetical protein